MSELLRYDQTLFRDRDVFDFAYVPEQIHHRDAQIRELAHLASPGFDGHAPHNAILQGPPGTGKTCTIHYLFSAIRSETQALLPVYINCEIDRTRFAVFARIYQAFSGYAPSPSGTSISDVMRRIDRAMKERGCTLLVCLDDASHLLCEQELSSVLYTLLRFHETYRGRQVGVFAITGEPGPDIRRDLDCRISSVFQPAEVVFSPYSRDEIRSILGDRIRQGLYPGVFPPALLDEVVERTRAGGDMRTGIGLIRRAVEIAEMDARKSVTAGDLETAVRQVVAPALHSRIRRLHERELALLWTIAQLALSGSVEMTAGAVYRRLVEMGGGMGYTTYHERLKRFEAAKIVDLPIIYGRGRRRRIVFRYPPAEVVEACSRYLPTGNAEDDGRHSV
ncbi:MAG: ORC1-type DNA replication protein [Methanoculleaceae archaeon]